MFRHGSLGQARHRWASSVMVGQPWVGSSRRGSERLCLVWQSWIGSALRAEVRRRKAGFPGCVGLQDKKARDMERQSGIGSVAFGAYRRGRAVLDGQRLAWQCPVRSGMVRQSGKVKVRHVGARVDCYVGLGRENRLRSDAMNTNKSRREGGQRGARQCCNVRATKCFTARRG